MNYALCDDFSPAKRFCNTKQYQNKANINILFAVHGVVSKRYAYIFTVTDARTKRIKTAKKKVYTNN